MGTPLIQILPTELALHTRQGNQVENYVERGGSIFGDELRMRDYIRQFNAEFHRGTLPSRKYNCHGLSFAAKRTSIENPTEVAKIVAEDEYEQVPDRDVAPGDIVIYYESGDAAHSGIVVRVNELRVPIVLSKWGHCHEVVHHLAMCPYKIGDVRYYRMKP